MTRPKKAGYHLNLHISENLYTEFSAYIQDLKKKTGKHVFFSDISDAIMSAFLKSIKEQQGELFDPKLVAREALRKASFVLDDAWTQLQ